jgi:acetyl-CoA carboxylase carboxyl transferase subunit beta
VATVLAAKGIVDVIVPEYPDAAQESGAFIERVSTAIAQELGELRCRTSKDRLRDRRVRYGGPVSM